MGGQSSETERADKSLPSSIIDDDDDDDDDNDEVGVVATHWAFLWYVHRFKFLPGYQL
jgi:hypothetical protein